MYTCQGGSRIVLQLLVSGAYLFIAGLADYTIPVPTVEILSPKGYRISIPNVQGLQFFAFHGSVSRPIKGVEPGDFFAEVLEPQDGKWSVENRKTRVDPGDTLYYWIHVQHSGRAYRALEQSLVIGGDIVNIDVRSEPPPPVQPVTPTQPSQPQPVTNRPTTAPTAQNCIPSKTRVRGQTKCKDQLIFNDVFDSLNPTIWEREIRIPLDLNDGDFVSFQNRDENLFVESGNLHIVPELLTEISEFSNEYVRRGELDLGQSCTGEFDRNRECKRRGSHFIIIPPVISARIRTKQAFTFLYGKVEIRAKLPMGDWLFPEIVLEPAENAYGEVGYASGQIRIAFIRGNDILDSKDNVQIDGHRLSGGAILSNKEEDREFWTKSTLQVEHWGKAFHTYSLTWTDEYITLAVDGNAYCNLRGGFKHLFESHNITHARSWQSGGDMAPFDREFYIALGVSAGGVSDFPNGCRTGTTREVKPWINTEPKAELKFYKNKHKWHSTWDSQNKQLLVDYVKVWAI